MKGSAAIVRRLTDPAIALGLAAAYVALLLSTVADLGYARDEGFYFQASEQYRLWFERFLADPAGALERSVIDKYWKANSLHPVFTKALFALSKHYLFLEWGIFSEEGTAFRFPGMVFSGMAVAVVYLWGRRAAGRLGGIVGALLFAMMPRVFYHSHLDCFDMPVLAMWLVTTYVYWLSLERGGLSWALFAGVLYGLLLNTKHNAWLLPPALIVHYLIIRGAGLRRDVAVGRTPAPLALFAMAVIGPVVFYATWPWIWHDTAERLITYVVFHVNHDYYNMEFLGRTYWRPPMPRLYAWVMTAATVPGITLVLFGLGLCRSLMDASSGGLTHWASRMLRRFGAGASARALAGGAAETSTAEAATEAPAADEVPRRRSAQEQSAFSMRVLWLLCLLTSYAPWLSKNTPIFGGTKHWITAYPFLCLFAAVGFAWALSRLRALMPGRAARARVAEVGLAAAVVAAPTVMTLQSHPWGLTAYTPLVGGAPGAATLGLNRGFWGYTTGAVQDFINDQAPPGAGVYVHDTALQSWHMMVKDGRLRRDLRGTLNIAASQLGLYHHEQHMSRVEHQLWVAYGTTRPAHVGTYHGVPVVWVYARPASKR